MATLIVTGILWRTGRTVRARLYPPGGGSVGQDLALAELPAGSGQYSARGTVTVSATTTEPYAIEARDVATQDTAGFDGSASVVLGRGDYAYSDGTNFIPEPATAAVQRNVTVVNRPVTVSQP